MQRALWSLIHPANHDTCLHRRVIEQIRSQTDYAFHVITAHQFLAHVALFVTEQDPMREENSAASGLFIQTLYDVLQECVVSAALWRHTEKVSAIPISRESITAPFLYGIWWIRQHQIKDFELSPLDKSRCRECVAVYNLEVLDPMKEQVHPCNGRGQRIDLLTIQGYISPFLSILSFR